MKNKFDFKRHLSEVGYVSLLGKLFAIVALVFSFYHLTSQDFHLSSIAFLSEEIETFLIYKLGHPAVMFLFSFLLQVVIYACVLYLVHHTPSALLAKCPMDKGLLRLVLLLGIALLQGAGWFYQGIHFIPDMNDLPWLSLFLPFNLAVIGLLVILLVIRLRRHRKTNGRQAKRDCIKP